VNRNVLLLSLCQALLTTGNVLLVSVNGLIGRELAPSALLITLPVALQFIGLMTATIPASLLMGRIGRKNGFYLGNSIGILGAALCILALYRSHFALFCIGTLLLGVGIGFGTLYRFAAVEVCPEHQQSKAISLVMAGGVLAAFLGPSLALYSRHWIGPTQFMGSFMGLLGLYVLALILLSLVTLPPPVTPEDTAEGHSRSLLEVLTQPVFIVAVVAGMSSYAVMNLIMTATPLAMERLGYSFAATTSVIKWHVLGMFLPSFFTGHLIQRFGTLSMIILGALLNFACIAINLSGQEEWHFLLALLLLGLGWNFMFISATKLVIECYRPSEKATVQAANEFLVFGMVTLSALSAGWMEARIGWPGLNLAMLPIMLLATVLIVHYSAQEKKLRSLA
jgi:predicted MFS family arabinose efflux permease